MHLRQLSEVKSRNLRAESTSCPPRTRRDQRGAKQAARTCAARRSTPRSHVHYRVQTRVRHRTRVRPLVRHKVPPPHADGLHLGAQRLFVEDNLAPAQDPVGSTTHPANCVANRWLSFFQLPSGAADSSANCARKPSPPSARSLRERSTHPFLPHLLAIRGKSYCCGDRSTPAGRYYSEPPREARTRRSVSARAPAPRSRLAGSSRSPRIRGKPCGVPDVQLAIIDASSNLPISAHDAQKLGLRQRNVALPRFSRMIFQRQPVQRDETGVVADEHVGVVALLCFFFFPNRPQTTSLRGAENAAYSDEAPAAFEEAELEEAEEAAGTVSAAKHTRRQHPQAAPAHKPLLARRGRGRRHRRQLALAIGCADVPSVALAPSQAAQHPDLPVPHATFCADRLTACNSEPIWL